MDEERESNAKLKTGDKLVKDSKEYHVYKIEEGFAFIVPYELYSRFGYEMKSIPVEYHLKVDLTNTAYKKRGYYTWLTKFEQLKEEFKVDSQEEFAEVVKKINVYPYSKTDLINDLKDMSAIVNKAYRGVN